MMEKRTQHNNVEIHKATRANRITIVFLIQMAVSDNDAKLTAVLYIQGTRTSKRGYQNVARGYKMSF